MKKMIRSNDELLQTTLDLDSLDIKSIAFVDDAVEYKPRNNYVYDIYATNDINYSALNREQLLALSKRDKDNIHDVDILRKLKFEELTLQQQRDVTQANKDYIFRITKSQFDTIINKLNKSAGIYIVPRKKNDDFRKMIQDLGGRVRDDDVLDIINRLSYDQGYKYSKLSYVDTNWNALLLIFKYDGSYTFQPRVKGESPITVDSLDVYIKIDVDNETDEGYAAISFHQSDPD